MQLANSIANNRFWNKHGVSITWGLAGLCLLLSAIYIGWTTYSQAQTRAANLQPQDIRPLAQPSRRLYQVTEITSANLFGDPTPRPVVTNAPKTTLNLTLQGVLSAQDQFSGLVVAWVVVHVLGLRNMYRALFEVLDLLTRLLPDGLARNRTGRGGGRPPSRAPARSQRAA